MFYLIHFTKIVVRFPVKVLSWFGLSIVLFSLTANPHLPLNLMDRYQSQDSEPSYFHALVDGQQNHSRLSRNLLELPQVQRVDLLDQEEIIDQVNMALSGIKHDLPEGLLALNYNGLKIYFADGVKDTSQNLVRDYLIRLGGANNITLGPTVKKQNIENKKHPWIDYLAYIILGVIIVLWGFLTFSFSKLIHRECYLIQEFQRREFVANKVYTVAIILVLFCAVVSTSLFGNLNLNLVVPSLLLLIPFAYLKRRYQW
jgi:hypothetical protein